MVAAQENIEALEFVYKAMLQDREFILEILKKPHN